MKEKQIKNSSLKLSREDITLREVNAFVYYAQHDLKLGSGFGGAISGRGGPEVQKELNELGEAKTGDAVVSGAGDLPADFIIHAVGPRFQEVDMEGKLRTTVLNVLARAEEKGAETLALPPMGVGFYGIPIQLSAKVTLETIASYLKEKETKLKEVVICLTDHHEMAPFETTLDKLN
jgi:O-acetyl-ADP-ribose deacetylase (regulator of RNase III)